MTTEGLSSDRIIELLSELGSRLTDRGIDAHLYIVGGSAMALAYNRDRLTRDIDAIYAPKSEVYREAELMAAEYPDIDSGWLNDAAKGYVNPGDTEAKVLTSVPGMTVSIASPRRLLAMKVLAARIDRDADDILTLVDIIGIQSIDEVLDIAEKEYGSRLLPKSRFLMEELLSDYLPVRSSGIGQFPAPSVLAPVGGTTQCSHVDETTGKICSRLSPHPGKHYHSR